MLVPQGSKVSLTGQGHTSGYAAAKGAINALTREWALSLLSYGIRVNAIIPAEVLTGMYENFLAKLPDSEQARSRIQKRIPLGNRFTTPQEIADAVAFLAGTRSSHTTGQLFFVDGGYCHLDRSLGLV